MIETITFKGKEYPHFQAEGNAARWIMPLALEICKGNGMDIGYSNLQWKMPNAYGIEPMHNSEVHAMKLPDCEYDGSLGKWDFIFSSHCLEHVKENWYNVVDYWISKLNDNGVLFLYLPHKSQEYWLPANNRKHIHSFDGTEIRDYLESKGYKVMLSGVDMNHSFCLYASKP